MCALLVGLPDVVVVGVGDWPSWLRIVVKAAGDRPVCACGGVVHRHGVREVEFVDLPVFGRPTRLVWRKQRWRCTACARYTAFVTDVCSRSIVGWRTASTMTADLVTDALEMAIFSRRRQLLRGVIAHSDAGSQYTSVTYTERLGEIGALASIGSIGDSFDNALAESVNGLYNTELIRRRGPWRHAEHVELETLAWVDWFNNRRLQSELGDIPPTEFEALHYARTRTQHQAPTPTRT